MQKGKTPPSRGVSQLNIRSEYAVRRARELAKATGTTTTKVVEEALRTYSNPESTVDEDGKRERLREIIRRANEGQPPCDWRAVEDEMYDEWGVPR